MIIKQMEESDSKNAIQKLSENDVNKIKSILDQDLLYAQFTQKAARAYNRSIAEEILFWDDILDQYERCETATFRNKLLTIKKDANDQYWIIEKDYINNNDEDDEDEDDEDEDEDDE